jgi:hypothetical protein
MRVGGVLTSPLENIEPTWKYRAHFQGKGVKTLSLLSLVVYLCLSSRYRLALCLMMREAQGWQVFSQSMAKMGIRPSRKPFILQIRTP